MSYRVFARKYRPQTFEQVVGQEHITRTLQNAITAERLAQAYLFVGPRGIGKTSTARILAKALNCANGPTIEPCGECDACREIAEGNSLDVLEIDGASNNSVDSVRELRENAAYAPARGPYKIYLIDEVHMLSTAAFNALLKTLEEPPPHVKFIFATTEAQKVPATITSRCQRFDLRRIPAELIAGHLQAIARNEQVELDDAAAAAIAKGADGGLRDAESMLDQLVAFCGNAISEEDVLTVFGFTARETVLDLCSRLFGMDATGALQVVADQSDAGRDLSRLLADVIAHLRDLLVYSVKPGSDPALATQSEAISREKLLTLLEHFGEVEGRLRWATDKRLYLDVAVIKAVHILDETSLSDVLDTLTAIGGGDVPVRHPRVSSEAREELAAQQHPSAPRQPVLRREVPLPVEPGPRPPRGPEAPLTRAVPVAERAVAATAEVESLPEAKLSDDIEPTTESNEVPVAVESEPEPPTESLFGALVADLAAGKADDPEPPEPTDVADTLSVVSAETEPPADSDPAAVWKSVAAALGRKSVINFSWLASGQFAGCDGSELTVNFPPSCRERVADGMWERSQQQIEAELLRRLERRVAFRCEFDDGLSDPVDPRDAEPSPAPEKAAPAAEVPKVDPMEEFRNDPLIRKAIEVFRAEIETA